MSLEERTKVKRIEPTFPGMEHLVAPSAHPFPPKEQIESIVTEILAEKTSAKIQTENSTLRYTAVTSQTKPTNSPGHRHQLLCHYLTELQLKRTLPLATALPN